MTWYIPFPWGSNDDPPPVHAFSTWKFAGVGHADWASYKYVAPEVEYRLFCHFNPTDPIASTTYKPTRTTDNPCKDYNPYDTDDETSGAEGPSPPGISAVIVIFVIMMIGL